MQSKKKRVQYCHYRSPSETIVKILRAKGLPDAEINSRMAHAYRQLLANRDVDRNVIDQETAVLEPASAGSPTVLISPDLIKRVDQISLNNIDGFHWHFPFPCIKMSLPHGSRFGDVGALVFFNSFEFFLSRFRLAGIEIEKRSEGSSLLYIAANVKDEQMQVPDGIPLKTARAVIRQSLDSTSISEFIKNGDTDVCKNNSIIPSESDNEFLNSFTEWVIKLGLYLSTQDDPVFVKPDGKVYGAPKDPDGDVLVTRHIDLEQEGGHFVKSHLRTLKDERFYKGKWALYPRGTRYSLVKPHIRG